MSHKSATNGDGEALEWTMGVPMVGDRFFALDILRWVLLTGVLVSVLMVVIGLVAEAPRMIPIVLLAVWAILGGLFLLSFLIALVVFRNRYYVHYRVDDTGAHYASVRDTKDLIDLTAAGNLTLGALLSSPAGAGAGLLSASRANVSARWKDLNRVVAHDAERVLALKNRWRTLFRLRCADDDSYARVKAFVTARAPARPS